MCVPPPPGCAFLDLVSGRAGVRAAMPSTSLTQTWSTTGGVRAGRSTATKHGTALGFEPILPLCSVHLRRARSEIGGVKRQPDHPEERAGAGIRAAERAGVVDVARPLGGYEGDVQSCGGEVFEVPGAADGAAASRDVSPLEAPRRQQEEVQGVRRKQKQANGGKHF
eukprot:1847071-Rhodomonas_salina.2